MQRRDVGEVEIREAFTEADDGVVFEVQGHAGQRRSEGLGFDTQPRVSVSVEKLVGGQLLPLVQLVLVDQLKLSLGTVQLQMVVARTVIAEI